jgi:signal transduction histidine kinase/DNA-binding response OmpR family regulator
MNLIDFKIDFLLKEEKCQVIFFDENGYVIDSCDTLLPLADYVGTTARIPLPILDSIHEILKDTPEKEPLIFPRVEVEFAEIPPQILDLILSKHQNEENFVYVCVIRDHLVQYNYLKEIVTEQRTTAIDKELLEIKHEKTALENELINLKNKELERARMIKNNFFAKASHELRTPVNGILGLTEMLTEHATEAQAEYLKALSQVANQLKTVVNDLLDLSKLEENKITFESTNFRLSDIFNNIYLAFKPLAEKKQIQIFFSSDIKVPAFLRGDSTRLAQIIYNLVGNALKFTEKGKITIHADVSEILHDTKQYLLKFVVQDTGVGIAADKLMQIFEPYSQESDETYRLYGGTGLGLTIVKQLVEAMGGKISVQSKPNEGSSFYFTLPFLLGNLPESTQIETAEENYQNRRALVADDNNINLIIIAKKLQDIGFETDKASNGQEALDKLEGREYDLLCLDVDMPVLDGYETTKQIRAKQEPYYQQLPIFLMTAYSYADIEEKVKDIGISDFLTKPFETKMLLQKLRKHLPQITSKSYEIQLNTEQINEFSQGDKEFEKELMKQVIQALHEFKTEYQTLLHYQITDKHISDLVHKYNMIFAMLANDILRQEIKNTVHILQASTNQLDTKVSLQSRIYKLCDEAIEQLEIRV